MMNNYNEMIDAFLKSIKILFTSHLKVRTWNEDRNYSPNNNEILNHIRKSINYLSYKYEKYIDYYIYISIFKYNISK